MDFQRLDYPQRFEALCRQILLLKYPRLKTVDGGGGDQGTDSFVGKIKNQSYIFQFKWFPKKLTSNHWTKIQKSLNVSSKKRPKKWILLMSSEFKQSDWKKWEMLEKQYPNITLEVRLNTNIESYVMQYQDRLAAEFPELFPRAVIGESPLIEARKRNYKLLSKEIFQVLMNYQLELPHNYPDDVMKLHYDLSGLKYSAFYEETYQHLNHDLPKSIVKPERLETLVKRYNERLQKFTEHKIPVLLNKTLSIKVPISYNADDVHTRSCIFLPNLLLILKRYWFAQWDFDYRYENNQLCIQEYIIANILSTVKNKLIRGIDGLKKSGIISSQTSILKQRRNELLEKNKALSTYIYKSIITQIQRDQYNTICKFCPK
jgi:hypothetical protein